MSLKASKYASGALKSPAIKSPIFKTLGVNSTLKMRVEPAGVMVEILSVLSLRLSRD